MNTEPESGPETDENTGPPSVRPAVASRATSRERAVHLLYESNIKDTSGEDVLASQKLAADAYATRLVSGVEANIDEIDGLIESLAPQGWPLDRMAALDLTVLRVACFELIHADDVPTGVVLSEAVALAEQYGTDDSHRFVNGLLAAAAKRVRE